MVQLKESVVTSLPLLTESECAQLKLTVEELQEHWIQRHPTVPFYTLGASNYFDIAYNPELPYYRMAQQYNPILRQHFAWLYDRLSVCLSQHLQAPTAYRESLALPGFHIFLSHPAFANPQALTHQEWFKVRYQPDVVSSPIHCDTPHFVVDWGTSREGLDFNHPISFTLAIALPTGGAGMYVWDLRLQETIGLSQEALTTRLNSREKQLCSYQEGSLSLHSGMYYHQVAPMPAMLPGDVRITLQGHGLMSHGVWQLYW